MRCNRTRQKLHLYSIAAPGMRRPPEVTQDLSRVLGWAEPVKMKPGWKQIQKGYFEAPGEVHPDTSVVLDGLSRGHLTLLGHFRHFSLQLYDLAATFDVAVCCLPSEVALCCWSAEVTRCVAVIGVPLLPAGLQVLARWTSRHHRNCRARLRLLCLM